MSVNIVNIQNLDIHTLFCSFKYLLIILISIIWTSTKQKNSFKYLILEFGFKVLMSNMNWTWISMFWISKSINSKIYIYNQLKTLLTSKRIEYLLLFMHNFCPPPLPPKHRLDLLMVCAPSLQLCHLCTLWSGAFTGCPSYRRWA